MQGMEKCSPRGRDCIEGNFTLTFNCSVNCEGIYADVQWVEDKIADEERTVGKRGMEQDKKKYMRLITEYNHFKENIVQHFRFSDAWHFGASLVPRDVNIFGRFNFV